MQATSQAQPNIALVKYWGKRDHVNNLPATGSLSLTLSTLWTRMTVEFATRTSTDTSADELVVNGEPAGRCCRGYVRAWITLPGPARPSARIASECNFPIGAGLASSASAFAALAVAASKADGRSTDRLTLARIAGRASGSAARSLYPGIVELHAGDRDIELTGLAAPGDWPLTVTVAVTSTRSKRLGSGAAMTISRETSPFFKAWVERQADDLAAARQAVAQRDFAALAAVAEHNCLKMHSVMWTSRPAIVYWSDATLACLETVRSLQGRDLPAFFTIDAGPQVKVVSLPEFAGDVAAALRDTPGVVDVMQSGLGDGARILEYG